MTINIENLFFDPSQKPKTVLKDGQKWGNWRFEKHSLTLQNDSSSSEVRLNEIENSAKMLSWIFHAKRNPRVSNEDMGNLLEALEYIFDPQTNLCPNGKDKSLDAPAYLKSLIVND